MCRSRRVVPRGYCHGRRSCGKFLLPAAYERRSDSVQGIVAGSEGHEREHHTPCGQE